MPKTKKGASLFEKYGKRVEEAHEKYKDTEILQVGFTNLPPGIKNGVAQLVVCEIREYEKGHDLEGEPYLYAQGVVLKPRYFTDTEGNEVKTEGAHTFFRETLCDTPKAKGKRKTFEDHMDNAYQFLGRMGVDRSDIDPRKIESTLSALTEEAPYFKFETWQGKATKEFPDPRVNEKWLEVIEDFDPDEDDETEDESGSADEGGDEDEVEEKKQTKVASSKKSVSKNGEAKKEEAKPSTTKAGKRGKAAKEEEVFDEGADLDSLAKKADNDRDPKQEDAQDTLTEMAIKLGYTQEEVDEADNWATVVEWIDAGPKKDDEEEEEEVTEPEEGDTVKYKPAGKKKALSCEVTKVFSKKKTATLKNLETDEEYQHIGWGEFISA